MLSEDYFSCRTWPSDKSTTKNHTDRNKLL